VSSRSRCAKNVIEEIVSVNNDEYLLRGSLARLRQSVKLKEISEPQSLSILSTTFLSASRSHQIVFGSRLDI